jgi:hypothetical protein
VLSWGCGVVWCGVLWCAVLCCEIFSLSGMTEFITAAAAATNQSQLLHSPSNRNSLLPSNHHATFFRATTTLRFSEQPPHSVFPSNHHTTFFRATTNRFFEQPPHYVFPSNHHTVSPSNRCTISPSNRYRRSRISPLVFLSPCTHNCHPVCAHTSVESM